MQFIAQQNQDTEWEKKRTEYTMESSHWLQLLIFHSRTQTARRAVRKKGVKKKLNIKDKVAQELISKCTT